MEAAGGLVWREAGTTAWSWRWCTAPAMTTGRCRRASSTRASTHETAALREVEEETGLRGGARGGAQPHFYEDHKGRSKRVRWWVMQALEGEFTPDNEVDEMRWVSPDEAAELLTYTRDRELVSDWLAGTPRDTSS